MRPYVTVQDRDLTIPAEVADIDVQALRRPYDADATDEPRMVVRTQQLLLSAPSRSVIDHATLAEDEEGEKFVAELALDLDFPDIVTSPGRFSGQPTFVGRRVAVATIVGMARGGDQPEDLAADYGLSLAQVRAAIAYAGKNKLTTRCRRAGIGGYAVAMHSLSAAEHAPLSDCRTGPVGSILGPWPHSSASPSTRR